MQLLSRFCALLLCVVSCTAQSEWTIPLEHSIDDSSTWTTRGQIIVFSSRADGTLTARYSTEGHEWTESDKANLVSAVKETKLYKIRAPANLDEPQINGANAESFVMSYTEPNRLVQSNLQEVLVVSVDMSQRRLLSITTQPILLNYDANYEPIVGDILSSTFNTTVRLTDVTEGPAPDTLAYILKLEREKQEREQGEQPDNRSFLAKYWMYIVPAVIFLMVSNAMNPEGAEGGGGGGGR